MSRQHWGTEKDVLKDLEQLYGMIVTNISKDAFVHGQGPPPPMITDKDDFQKACDDNHDDNPPPDLKGIVQMLKIVKEHEKEDDDHDEIKINGQSNQTQRYVVSKLNPNVAEFEPQKGNKRTMTNGTKKVTDLQDENKYNKLKENLEKGEKVKDNVSKDNVGNADEGANVSTVICNNVDIKMINNKEREKLAEHLRNQICNDAKANTFQSKKQKNLAITTLLKLYSKPVSSQLENNDTPKLITPDYFARSKAESPKASETDEASNECNSNSTGTPELNALEDTKPSRNVDVSNVEIEKSIEKVNNWLNPSLPKAKTPSVYLGKVAFKRKESSSCKSIKSDKQLSNSSTTAQYKPSKYAEELAMKYDEMKKANEATAVMDPVAKIVIELKARDGIIKQRAMEKRASKINRQSADTE